MGTGGPRKKITRGNILRFTQTYAGQEKCGILYKHCFSTLVRDILCCRRINREKKYRTRPLLGIVFPIGQTSRNPLAQVFFLLVSATLLQELYEGQAFFDKKNSGFSNWSSVRRPRLPSSSVSFLPNNPSSSFTMTKMKVLRYRKVTRT